MREGAKQRLLGATAIVALAVIFVPMLFEEKSQGDLPPLQGTAPVAPTFDPSLKSEVFLGPGDSGVGGLDDSQLTDSQPLPLPPGGIPEPAAPAGPSLPPEAEAPPPEPADETSESQPTPGSAGVASGKASGTGVKATPEPTRGASDGMPSWVIQVASAATPEGAAQLESKLRSSGFAAFVEKADVNGKTYYRVRVGPEADRARAEQTAARLRARHKLDTLIQGYP